jgi:hypothetical protein
MRNYKPSGKQNQWLTSVIFSPGATVPTKGGHGLPKESFTLQIMTGFNQKFLPGGPDASRGRFLQKGVGDPTLFTVSLMPFFRRRHLKSLSFLQAFTGYY